MGENASAGAGDVERELVEEATRVGELAHKLQEAAASLISRNWNEEQALLHRAVAVESDLRKLQDALDSAVREGHLLDPKIAEKVRNLSFSFLCCYHILIHSILISSLVLWVGVFDVSDLYCVGVIMVKLDEELYKARLLVTDGDVGSLLPTNAHGRFLKMLLGPINVHVKRKDVRFKVKEEYNSYRDKTAFQFLVFPTTLLILRSRIWNGCFPALPVQLYQAWLFFLYTSLALRENILRINGSDIRPWWIYHHYCAMVMALVCLTWEIKGQPDCANKQKGVELFLIWAIMQGFAMILQNRYQRQRLYTRIALGKARRMDVVWGETAGVEGQLWLLYPILFILQGFEAYVGLLLLRTSLDGVVSEWQVVFCGILLVVMAVGNFANTVKTLIAKSRFKAKMKRTKIKQDVDHRD